MFSYSRNYIVKECDQSVVALLNLTLYTATFSSCSGPLINWMWETRQNSAPDSTLVWTKMGIFWSWRLNM